MIRTKLKVWMENKMNNMQLNLDITHITSEFFKSLPNANFKMSESIKLKKYNTDISRKSKIVNFIQLTPE